MQTVHHEVCTRQAYALMAACPSRAPRLHSHKPRRSARCRWSLDVLKFQRCSVLTRGSHMLQSRWRLDSGWRPERVNSALTALNRPPALNGVRSRDSLLFGLHTAARFSRLPRDNPGYSLRGPRQTDSNASQRCAHVGGGFAYAQLRTSTNGTKPRSTKLLRRLARGNADDTSQTGADSSHCSSPTCTDRHGVYKTPA